MHIYIKIYFYLVSFVKIGALKVIFELGASINFLPYFPHFFNALSGRLCQRCARDAVDIFIPIFVKNFAGKTCLSHKRD
jgi:hypothetical protein